MASIVGALKVVHSVTVATEENTTEAANFQSIISSLIEITHHVEIWGGLLNNVSISLHISTVSDIAEALNDLDKELRSLEQWLENKNYQYWIVLQRGLLQAHQSYNNSKTRPYISSYLSFLRSKKSLQSQASVRYESYRMMAGDGLLELSSHLNRAAEQAVASSRSDLGNTVFKLIEAKMSELRLISVKSKEYKNEHNQPDQYSSFDVFYATDRKNTGSANPSNFYDNRRSAKLSFGVCEVLIPIIHRYGKIELPSAARLEFKKDPSKHFVLIAVKPLDTNEFLNQTSHRLSQTEGKEALVFIHGYNTSFEDAAYRTAQIAYDLKFDGVAILYSWPSKGELTGYTQDAQTIQWTAGHLQEFLELISEKTGAERIHLIAHSMGNQALSRALDKIADKMQNESRVLFEQVLLTAPDIDIDLFISIAENFRKPARRVTLYASSKDRALIVSRMYQGYPRVGDTSDVVVIVPGIDTIDASAVDTNLMGHSYYSENRSVLSDIYYLIQEDKSPDKRFGLEPKLTPEGKYWIFKQ